ALTERQQSLTRRHEPRQRLLQICQRSHLFIKAERAARQAESRAVMNLNAILLCSAQSFNQRRPFAEPGDELEESPPQRRAARSRLTCWLERAQATVQGKPGLNPLLRSCTRQLMRGPAECRFERAGFEQVIAKENFQPRDFKRSRFDQRFQPERMRRR